MTQQEWDVMSVEEKHELLQSHQAKVSTQTAMNGMAKVGSNEAIITVYSVYRGTVLTGRADNLLDAAKMDAESCGLTNPQPSNTPKQA